MTYVNVISFTVMCTHMFPSQISAEKNVRIVDKEFKPLNQ